MIDFWLMLAEKDPLLFALVVAALLFKLAFWGLATWLIYRHADDITKVIKKLLP